MGAGLARGEGQIEGLPLAGREVPARVPGKGGLIGAAPGESTSLS